MRTWIFTWFLQFLILLFSVRVEGFLVRGPVIPLVVQLGSSVTLPCSVDTPLPLQELEVQWMREDSGSLVHLFQEGEPRPESQSPPYRGRSHFFAEEISRGNFSLLLRNVTAKDKGLYRCVVHTDQESNETQVKIDIEQLVVTGADVPVSAYVGEDVILNCSVDTHVPLSELEVEWMKTNGEILVLLFAEGENRPESQHERFSGRAEFFSEEIPKGNFSLKLRNVKIEDKGEYMCKVHTDRESVNATAWLQELGLSTLHVCILVLTTAAAVLSCISAVYCILNRDGSNRTRLLFHGSSCILISIAFGIWGHTESSVGEAYVCSSVNLMRILVIFNMYFIYTPPYKTLCYHTTCYKRFTCLVLPLEDLVIKTGINSIILPKFLTHYAPDTERKMWPQIFFGVMLLSDLLAICVSVTGLKGIPLCTKFPELQGFSSVFLWLNWSAYFEVAFLISTREGPIFALIWFLASTTPYFGIQILYFCESCLHRKKYGYLCQKVLLVLFFILQVIVSILCLDSVSKNDKDRLALMCFCAFLFTLDATVAFQESPAELPIPLYVFGSAVLSIINSVTLATELILKTKKGERSVDLRAVVLPFESFFLACYLCLQMKTYCKRNEELIRKQLGLIGSCKTRGQSPTSSHQNQTPEEAVEMMPPSTCPTQGQEETDDGPRED